MGFQHTNAQTCTHVHTRTCIIAHTAHINVLCLIYVLLLLAEMLRRTSSSMSSSSRCYISSVRMLRIRLRTRCITTIQYSECDHEIKAFSYEYIKGHTRTVKILEAAYSLLLFRRKKQNRFVWFLMTENTARGVRYLPRLNKYLFVVYPSNCHVVIILCDVGGGSTGVIREPRHRPLLLVSYRTARIRELPHPADWPGH